MKQPLLSVYDLVHYLKQTLDHDPNLQTLLIQGEISPIIVAVIGILR